MVYYPSDLWKMVAYLSNIPTDGKVHPAIIWISGGIGNDISNVWDDADAENDQTASSFRKAGIIMMYPAQRGGYGNPGYDESCYGEIDDILRAANYLRKQKGIDPTRIYLGGHSTGGTKVLLAAECSQVFRSVFSFGPVESVNDYGTDMVNFDVKNKRKVNLRSPALWFRALQTPIYVIEGSDGNITSLRNMRATNETDQNKFLHFYEVHGKTRFSVLQPVCKIIAKKILIDTLKKVSSMDLTGDISAFN